VSARFASENIRDTEKFVHLSCQEEVLVSIDTTLQKLWSVEDLPAKAKVHTPEQQLCEQDFEKNTQKPSSGLSANNHMKLRKVDFFRLKGDCPRILH